MTPLTRKENYLNEIVGWGETAPEKPLTPEEFFFAAILGEAVQTPEPLSRYQIYLAKIAGRNISVPKPLTRLELFLAKACGMDIETPTPITREEIFWSNYTAIVDFEVEGVPPLTFKGYGKNLENYRIYGNTETIERNYSGESPLTVPVTDGEVTNYRIYGRNSRNLFDYHTMSNGQTGKWIDINGNLRNESGWSISDYIPLPIDITAIAFSAKLIGLAPSCAFFNDDKIHISSENYNNRLIDGGILLLSVPNGAAYFVFSWNDENINDLSNIMLNSGSTALPYEPYGESVGDRTGNLWDESYDKNIDDNVIKYVPLYVGDGTFTLSTNTPKQTGAPEGESHNSRFIFFFSGAVDTGAQNVINGVSNGAPRTVTSDNGYVTIAYRKINEHSIAPWNYQTMLNSGSEALPYEPYGYRVPVTVTNGNNSQTTNLYLPEPIKMVGDKAEYVDFYSQKQYFADGTSANVTIPVLPVTTGTNTVTVSTAVPPSSITVDVDETVSVGDLVASGQHAGEYEVPVTVTNGTDTQTTTIYLTEQIKMVGDEAEYVDYKEQKQYFADGTSVDVTLPALPTLTGTNVLTVGTQIQPSEVWVKYKGERQ